MFGEEFIGSFLVSIRTADKAIFFSKTENALQKTSPEKTFPLISVDPIRPRHVFVFRRSARIYISKKNFVLSSIDGFEDWCTTRKMPSRFLRQKDFLRKRKEKKNKKSSDGDLITSLFELFFFCICAGISCPLLFTLWDFTEKYMSSSASYMKFLMFFFPVVRRGF